jgi:uncharacterized surface protein with fasciclin (FAS1) repeats
MAPAALDGYKRRLLSCGLCALTQPLWAQQPTPEQRAAQIANLQRGIAQLRAKDLPTTLAASSCCRVFLDLLQNEPLPKTLSASASFVFFVPTDTAWEQYAGIKQLQNASPAEKVQAVLRHVCIDNANAIDSKRKVYRSLAGTFIEVNEDVQQVNGLGFMAQNIRVSNGVLHIVYGVLS